VSEQVRRAGDPPEAWQVVGGALFGVGLLAMLVAIVPLVLGTGALPLPLELAGLLAPIGAGVALLGSAVNRRRQR
jgi:hypothetical protein